MDIRQATLADLDDVAALFDRYRQFYGQAPAPFLARDFIRERMVLRESVVFIARDGEGPGLGRSLGFTQLYPSFSSVSACRTWILNDLFVEELARGKGIGRALLNAARSHAAATGAKRLDLSTAQNNPAQKLYEKHGYVRDNEYYSYSLQVE